MATFELTFVDERPELEITVEETSLVLDTAGIQGPAGPGMTVKGSVEAVEALPTDAEINDGYFIGQEFYVLSEDGWHNAGFVRGAEGEQGPEGPMGPIGPQGETGATGPQGLQGPQGTKGDKGDRGDVGPKGDTGAVGPEGPIGERGPQGLTGPKGDKGDVGPQGQIGPVGPRGSKGDKGDTGATGADSTVPGPEGPRGPMGLQGPQGDKGDTGSQGPVGPQGQTGAEGESAYALAIDNGFVGTEAEWLASLEGPQGPEGEEGATRFIVWDGTAYPARPDADPVTFYGPENPNTLGLMTVGDTWINPNGDYENAGTLIPGPEGPEGPQGPEGPAGPAGQDGEGIPSVANIPNGWILEAYEGTSARWAPIPPPAIPEEVFLTDFSIHIDNPTVGKTVRVAVPPSLTGGTQSWRIRNIVIQLPTGVDSSMTIEIGSQGGGTHYTANITSGWDRHKATNRNDAFTNYGDVSYLYATVTAEPTTPIDYAAITITCRRVVSGYAY